MSNLRITFITIIIGSCADGFPVVGEDSVGEVHSHLVTLVGDGVNQFGQFGSKNWTQFIFLIILLNRKFLHDDSVDKFFLLLCIFPFVLKECILSLEDLV